MDNQSGPGSVEDPETPQYSWRRECPFTPVRQHTELRGRGRPVRVLTELGRDAWLISRLDQVHAVLLDQRFSSNPATPGFPLAHPDQGTTTGGSMIRSDGDEHRKLRRAFIWEFSARRIAGFRPRIQELASVAAARLGGRGAPVDLVREFAYELPAEVIRALLGIPDGDAETFRRLALAVLDPDIPPAQRTGDNQALVDYLEGLVIRRHFEPGRGLLGRLVAEHVHPGGLTPRQFSTNIRLIVAASHETTANMIALGMFSLLSQPRQRAWALSDDRRLAVAVEELLRYWSVVQAGPRRAVTATATIEGVTINAGDGVIVSLPAANRDPAAVEGRDPESLDLSRGPGSHGAFGFGPHQCLGQNLARTELHIAYTTLFRHFPSMRLAVPEDQVNFIEGEAIHGLRALPVYCESRNE